MEISKFPLTNIEFYLRNHHWKSSTSKKPPRRRRKRKGGIRREIKRRGRKKRAKEADEGKLDISGWGVRMEGGLTSRVGWGGRIERRGVVLTRTGAFLIIICLSLGISREGVEGERMKRRKWGGRVQRRILDRKMERVAVKEERDTSYSAQHPRWRCQRLPSSLKSIIKKYIRGHLRFSSAS